MPNWAAIANLDEFVHQHTGHGGMDVKTIDIHEGDDVIVRDDVTVLCRRCSMAWTVGRADFLVWGHNSGRWGRKAQGEGENTLLMSFEALPAPRAVEQPIPAASKPTRLITLEDE